MVNVGRPPLYHTREEKLEAKRAADRKYYWLKKTKCLENKKKTKADSISNLLRTGLSRSALNVSGTTYGPLTMGTNTPKLNKAGLLRKKIEMNKAFSTAFTDVTPNVKGKVGFFEQLSQWIGCDSYSHEDFPAKIASMGIDLSNIRHFFNGVHARRIIDNAARRWCILDDQHDIRRATFYLIEQLKLAYAAALAAGKWLDTHANATTISRKAAHQFQYWKWQEVLILRHEARMRFLHEYPYLIQLLSERKYLWQTGWSADIPAKIALQRHAENALMPDSSEPESLDEYESMNVSGRHLQSDGSAISSSSESESNANARRWD